MAVPVVSDQPATLLPGVRWCAVVARLYQVPRHGGLAGGIADALRGAVSHATALAVATTQRRTDADGH